ncbi:MAG: hypothetical protein Fur0017_03130 [Anaerolineales bacterium]
MLARISNTFYSVSTGWAALFGLVVFVLFMIFVLPQQAEKAEIYSSGVSPDTSYIYSASDLYQMAEDYGVEGRAAYIYARFTFDLIFPIAYLFFLTTSISWLLTRGLSEGSRWRLLNLFPLTGVVFDYLENTSASLVLGRYPAQTPVVDVLAPIFTAMKWFFVNGSFVILMLGMLLLVWRRLRR